MNAPAKPQKDQKNQKPRTAGPEAVAARAARMARRELGQKVEAWASKLGIKAERVEDFEKALGELADQRAKGMSEGERASARLGELEGQMKRLHDENERLRKSLNRSEKERKREVQRRQNEEIEAEIRNAAQEAGFKDPRYALHLFREHVVGDGPHAGDPKAFFETLKSKDDFKPLFKEAVVAAGPREPAPKPADDGAAAAGGGNGGAERRTGDGLPDQGPPAPPKPGKTKPEDGGDVGKLDKRTFAQRTQERYGFRPSM